MTAHEQTQAVAAVLAHLPFWVRVAIAGILDAMEYTGTDIQEDRAQQQFRWALEAAGVKRDA